jgi:hypothetical protein
LLAQGREDVALIRPLVQDALIRRTDIDWRPRAGRLALLLTRLRHEVPLPPTRISSLWLMRGVVRVAARGFAGVDDTLPLVLLSVSVVPGRDPDDPAATVMLHFASGDAAPRDLKVVVEAIDWSLEDVSEPWPAQATPDHDA